MKESIMKFVYRIRIGIYLTGILAFFLSLAMTCRGIESANHPQFESPQMENKGEDREDTSDFWPPDMVPHPHVPEPEKKEKDDLA